MDVQEFKATNLTISTCTVICNLNSKINLEYFTRFVPVHNIQAPQLNTKDGGIYNVEFYGNCARGETLIDKIKDEFNNQTTVKFKYWGFRMVNVKVFRNGKLQMTGLKYEDESAVIGNLLINIIKNIQIPVMDNIKNITNIQPSLDIQFVYDNINRKITYYRRYHNRFLKNYNFELEELYSQTPSRAATISLQTVSFDIKNKNFVKGLHDTYNDVLEDSNKDFLESNEWYGDNAILKIIDMIEFSKNIIEKELGDILTTSRTLLEVREKVIKLQNKFLDFKFIGLTHILTNITDGIYQENEQSLKDLKTEIYQFLKQYNLLLNKKISRLITIRNADINICSNLEKYFISGNATSNCNNNNNSNGNNYMIPISELELKNAEITKPHNYFVSNLDTVLINSDLNVNFNIHLNKLSKILKKKGLFNTYEPDDHSGVNLRYYWNKDNETQGFCKCIPHCSTKEKKSICTKITVLIFRPGSVIITGSRSIEQLKNAHKFVLKLLADHMETIRIDDDEDDENKHISLLNNEFRKMSRKPRLFYIKKINIIGMS